MNLVGNQILKTLRERERETHRFVSEDYGCGFMREKRGDEKAGLGKMSI